MIYYEVDFEDYVDKFVPGFLNDYDFEIRSGDFLQIDTTEQESHFILIARRGQYYFDIRIGTGIYSYINSNVNKAELKKVIKSQLTYDGIKVDKINILTIDDLINAGVTDTDLIHLVEKNKFIIDMEISR